MPKSTRLEGIDVVRREGDLVHVLGRNENYLSHIIHDIETGRVVQEESFLPENAVLFFISGFFMVGTLGLAYPIFKNQLDRVRKTENYQRIIQESQKANIGDLYNSVRNIRIYQGSLDEVSAELGKPLKRVDTGRPQTFIRSDYGDKWGGSDFWLRVEAYTLGADAIVHYQPGSSIGTPVKFVE